VSSLFRVVPLGMLTWLALAGNVGRAAPANDNFASAQVLSGKFGTLTADNTAATVETGEPNHAGLPPKASVWYQWTATEEGPVEFDTYNSSIDTVLAVYTGSTLANLNMVVANDDINSSNPQGVGGDDFGAVVPGNDLYKKNPYFGP